MVRVYDWRRSRNPGGSPQRGRYTERLHCTGSLSPVTFRRARLALPLLLIAWFFNAIAPVLAYAAGEPLHDAAGRHVVAACPAPAPAHEHGASAAHGETHASHAGSAHHVPCAAPDAPAAPHCPYCLDFAAGAALGSAPSMLAGVSPRAQPPAVVVDAPVAVGRASRRLPAPRAPPLLA